MSRFTASPFRKPSPYDLILPMHHSSPPETKSDSVRPFRTAGAMSALPPLDLDHTKPHSSAPITDTTGSRFRQTSSLTYHNSSLRESLERTVQRSPKMLIVVIPPSALSQEHGQLGHTLSSGPRHRLSQGVLMPLFPTMYGQLSAIAREYNFPSTAGLCLYLHYWDGGITHTPRISDDTWSFLWGSIFESHSPASPNPQLPINGRIEFDIDSTQARWYSSWISSSRRRNMDFPISIGTQSTSHSRHESRVTYAEEQAGDIQVDDDTIAQQPKPIFRHIPKKLSLVDRFDRFAGLKQVESHAFPAIVQKDEPQTSKYDLERRVNSWMAGASLASAQGPSNGRTNGAPATVPVLPPLDPPEDSSGIEFNLDDFTWSVSSPNASHYNIDPLSPSCCCTPSLHLANRVEGSVCLTPSTCTSRRNSVYEICSPVSAVSRIPSLDLGQRMLDDSPPTPSTMTSWGPQSYPPSPLSYYRPPSVDIGARQGFSRPATPSTATSWGPPLSWPASPGSEHVRLSIHLGERGDWSRPVTPSTATSWGAPLSYPPSPSTPFYVHTPDSGQRAFCPLETVGIQVTPWLHVWPYCQVGYEVKSPNQMAVQPSSGALESLFHYPCFNIYPAVYPHFDLHPVSVLAEENPNSGYPHFNLYPTIAFEYAQQTKQVAAQAGSLGPPAVYHTVIDLEHLSGSSQPIATKCSSNMAIDLTVQYPTFDLYPAVYPNVVPYPPKSADLIREASSCPDYDVDIGSTYVSVRLGALYPAFDLYPAMYPVLDIYPALPIQDVMPSSSKDTPLNYSWKSAAYPAFDLYPAGYPHFDLYPATLKTAKDEIVNLRAAKYPSFELYPAVYPHFEIYGPSTVAENTVMQAANHVEMNYPAIDLYQPLCRHVDLFPVNSGLNKSVESPSEYPAFDLYPPVYPHLDLYPGTSTIQESNIATVRLPAIYPGFDIYPSVYPHLDIYSTKLAMQESDTITVRLPAIYPAFDLYPSTYPHFNLWPSILQVLPTWVLNDDIPRQDRAHELRQTTLQNLSRSGPEGLLPQVMPSKSHSDLHHLPNGNVSTPSGTTTEHIMSKSGYSQYAPADGPIGLQLEICTDLRHSMSPNSEVPTAIGTIKNHQPKSGYSSQEIHQRSQNVLLAEPSHLTANIAAPAEHWPGSQIIPPPSFLMPNVIRKLPATPTNNAAYRTSTLTSPMPPSDLIRVLSNPPTGNPLTSTPTNRPRRGVHTMSSQSDLVVSPPKSVNDLVLYHSRSLSESSPQPRPSRTRDSLVLQRVKTYNNLPSANDSEVSSPVGFTSTLAKFSTSSLSPIPPVPALPRIGKAPQVVPL